MGSERIAVAMSGGVDSSVAAALLLKQGFEVIGIHMKLFESKAVKKESRTCCSLLDSQDAKKVCNKLGIPFFVLDMQAVFYEKVIRNFLEEYSAGRTPNPCIHCNMEIKNEFLFREITKLGCSKLATGHYARINYDETANRFHLKKAVDVKKDQSYFLFGTRSEQLDRLLFPLGESTKEEIREIARELDLPTAEKAESQEICFVDDDYRDLIYSPEQREGNTGNIVNTSGQVLGKHNGIGSYTIGQRRGLGISHTAPLYVLRLDPQKNEVVVGSREESYSSRLTVKDLNWIEEPPPSPFQATVKVRYSQEGNTAVITLHEGEKASMSFQEPIFGITPGQAAVCYQDDILLGGGWIDSGGEN